MNKKKKPLHMGGKLLTLLQLLLSVGLLAVVWNSGLLPVSYTHLDVYKRQGYTGSPG